MATKSNQTQRIKVGRVYLLKRSNSPMWYVEWCQEGVQRRESTKTSSKKEAMRKAQEKSAKLTLGQLEAPAKRRNETLGKAIAQRLEFLKSQRPCERTVTGYRRAYDQLLFWAQQELGREPKLADLTADLLHGFERALRDKGVQVPPTGRRRRQGGGNSPGTLHGKMEAVRSLITWAVDYGLVGTDPSARYKVPPRDRPDIEGFTSAQVRRILEDPDPNMRDIWLVFLRTGMRSAELRYLLKEDVDLNTGLIRIRKKPLPGTNQIWAPKHGHERTIPFKDVELAAVLQRQMERSPGPWVFHTGDNWKGNGGRWRPARLLSRFQRHLKNVGIGHGTLHMLRHTCITYLANNPSIPIVQVKEFAGHRDINVTMRYTHVRPSDISHSLGAVDFDGMTGQNEGKQK